MKKLGVGTFIWLIMVLAAPLAFASVIYEQYGYPPASADNLFSYGSKFVADDFTVSANAQLAKLTFEAWTTTATSPVTDVYVRLYTDNGSGNPASLFYDQHLTGTFNGVYTGDRGAYTLRDFTFDLPPQNLTTGTYWLALKVAPAQYYMLWSVVSTTNLIGLESRYSDDGSPWSNAVYENSFRLEGNAIVPIPPTAWLLGFGLMPLLGIRRFIRK